MLPVERLINTGFSPVTIGRQKKANRFNGFWAAKTVETVNKKERALSPG
jgi:hypothetical protein